MKQIGGYLFQTHFGQSVDGDKKSWDEGLVEWMFKRLYDPPSFEIPLKKLVLDIGAHIGGFSVYASQRASKVYAYEPEPSNFNLLQLNLQLNDITNVIPTQAAVSDRKGKPQLFLMETRNTGGHTLYKHLWDEEYPFSTITVKSLAFSDIVASLGEIGFVKMDCEGCEYHAILSTPDKVLQNIEKMVLECHNDLFVDKLTKKLEKGFTMKTEKEHHLMFARRISHD